jgi:hypothetical protein
LLHGYLDHPSAVGAMLDMGLLMSSQGRRHGGLDGIAI